MKDWQSIAHTKWECKYHVVIVPKYRHKVLYGKVKKKVGEILRELCRYKGIELLEGHAMPDHIHMCISVPPKYSIAMTIGYLKGKSAIRIHREILGVKRGFTNKNFWTRGYCVSTVGLNEQQIRKYIQNQEKLDSGEEGQLYLEGVEIK
ncbi:IS200/IS605 family transposase ISDha13 [Spirochaetia bacterium]|nr:IS200/IS605 family transposase ISDha13 [Spirochaetia bacterium]